MKAVNHLLVFALDEFRYALYLPVVERVFRVVAITPLPQAPDIVLGVINLQGRVVPVVNVRKRFRLPEREIDLGDQLILTRTSRRSVALLADSVGAVIEYSPKNIVSAQNILPWVEYVAGVVKLEDGMVLIHDLETFLSLDEEKKLGEAMKNKEDEDGP